MTLQARTPGSPYRSVDKHYDTPERSHENTAAKEARMAYSNGFTPSKMYSYQKKKFDWDRKQKCDRVNMFQRVNTVWQTDKYLNSNFKYNSIESKEGRKLNLGAFYNKFKNSSPIKK